MIKIEERSLKVENENNLKCKHVHNPFEGSQMS